MRHIQTGSGYYYKEYANGKKCRISKKEYLKKKKGGGKGNNQVLPWNEMNNNNNGFNVVPSNNNLQGNKQEYRKIAKLRNIMEGGPNLQTFNIVNNKGNNVNVIVDNNSDFVNILKTMNSEQPNVYNTTENVPKKFHSVPYKSIAENSPNWSSMNNKNNNNNNNNSKYAKSKSSKKSVLKTEVGNFINL